MKRHLLGQWSEATGHEIRDLEPSAFYAGSHGRTIPQRPFAVCWRYIESLRRIFICNVPLNTVHPDVLDSITRQIEARGLAVEDIGTGGQFLNHAETVLHPDDRPVDFT